MVGEIEVEPQRNRLRKKAVRKLVGEIGPRRDEALLWERIEKNPKSFIDYPLQVSP